MLANERCIQKKVAVIGQGESARGLGREIDACDFIVRLRAYWYNGAKDAGRKVDAVAWFGSNLAAFLCQGFFTQEREDPLIHAITLQSIVEQMPKKAVIILAMEPPMVAQSVLGDITAAIFARAGASGVILDGYTRDVSRISQMSFPLWSRGATVRDANGKWTIGQIGMSHLPKAGVSANDTILADRDGILVIPSEHQEAVFRAISSIGEHETRIRAAIRNGRKPDDIVQEFGIW